MKPFALRSSSLFFALLAAYALTPSAHAQTAAAAKKPALTFTTVDYPGATTQTAVDGINDFNDFVGIYDDATRAVHGFLGYKGSTHYTPIDYPGAAQTYLFRINNWGEIVGTYFDQAGLQHGFVRYPGLGRYWPAIYLPVDYPGAAPTAGVDWELGTGLGTSAFGLNDWGEVVGQYADKNSVGQGYQLSYNGFTSYTEPDASVVPGFFGGTALADINDYGDTAGEYGNADPADPIYIHGFFVHRGKATKFDPPGSVLTQVFGINNRREVSGFYYDSTQIGHGYIYSQGKYTVVDVPNAVYVSTVGTVNNGSEFVGEYTDGAGVTHGYVATRH